MIVCVRNDSKEIGIAGKFFENLRKILDTVRLRIATLLIRYKTEKTREKERLTEIRHNQLIAEKWPKF